MTSAVDKIIHLACRVNRQRVLGNAGPRQNEFGHLASALELPVRSLCQQRDHQVFQRDYADAKLDQFGIVQFGDS
jgi:hypothetical protein